MRRGLRSKIAPERAPADLMPQNESHTRRSPGLPSGADTAHRSPVSLLAHEVRQSALLPMLHQHAIDRTGGQCSLLFQHNPRNGALHATSGFGLDTLRSDPWQPAHDEAAIVTQAFERRAPVLVRDADRRAPELAARLATRSALLLPLVRGDERRGILAIGFSTPPAADVDEDVAEVGDAFLTALELFHLRQSEELQRDVRALLADFSASLSATLNLSGGLDIFCHGTNLLFGADRTSVWIHDRRARSLVLQASSDTVHATRGTRVGVDDPSAPAAAAMRRNRAEIVTGASDEVTATVTVTLRGTRRALGTHRVRAASGSSPAASSISWTAPTSSGRQLASAIENMQLLDDLIRSRRELENTFDLDHQPGGGDRSSRPADARQSGVCVAPRARP